MALCPNCFSDHYQENTICPICHFDPTVKRNSKALPTETVLSGRYLIGKVLGIGGFGVTYVAYDYNMQEKRAIKEYFPSEWASRVTGEKQIVASGPEKAEYFNHGLSCFMNEAKILNGLRKYNSIVDVFDFFEENGTAYMVMEYIEGNTLGGFLKQSQHRRLPVQAANKIIYDTGMALINIHKHMILHRDVGPENIMINRQNEIKLIDFGATRIYALNSPKSMSVLVKPGFAPIEQYSRGGNQGPWTDIYALAATYYFLVSGIKPPEAPDRIMGATVTPLHQFVPGVPPHISRAISHALEMSWRDRPQKVERFLEEMCLMKRKETTGPSLQNHDWNPDYQNTGHASVLLQVGNMRQRFEFPPDGIIKIGRDQNSNYIYLRDQAVSASHCIIKYVRDRNEFLIANYSGNGTYTKRGLLKKDQWGKLHKDDWFYIQTMRNRFIFYLEVE